MTDGYELIASAAYAAHGPPHASWAELRRESPVHRCTPPGFGPFWAITKHADIREISTRPDTFLNAPGIVMQNLDEERRGRVGALGEMRTVIEMDPPLHRSMRKVASPSFTPRALERLEPAIAASAREVVDRLAGRTGEGECDFAIDVAAAHPLRILSTILGVPREEEATILRLTNELFAADDPELQRQGEDRRAAIEQLGLELYQLFARIIEDRRARPREDLASILANARIDGELLGPVETFGYYLIVFTAGHDTTKNAIVGGMRALIEHPAELEKLRRRPELVETAVEEIVRWTSPVNYMKRTAARDATVRGVPIRKGDALILFYASANRDEEVFDDPFAFRVDRDPNPHLGFGIGEHFCLGANLARRSQHALFRELIPRLESVELTGAPEQIASSFVVGLKHLPIRYALTPAR